MLNSNLNLICADDTLIWTSIRSYSPTQIQQQPNQIGTTQELDLCKFSHCLVAKCCENDSTPRPALKSAFAELYNNKNASIRSGEKAKCN